MFDAVLRSKFATPRIHAGLRPLLLGVACTVLGAAQAQAPMSLQAAPKHYELNEAIAITINFDQAMAACGLVLNDGAGNDQRIIARGNAITTHLRYPQDGRYRLHALGKPSFEGYDLYPACPGQAQLTVMVESKANRQKRLAAEATAKKVAEARAIEDAARQEAEARAREEAQRAEAEADVARQKAALETAARQRAMDLAKRKAEAKAELEAARAIAKRQAEMTPLDRIMGLLGRGGASTGADPKSSSAGASEQSCKLQSEKNVGDKEKQCLYTCADGSLEGRTRERSVDCPAQIQSANS